MKSIVVSGDFARLRSLFCADTPGSLPVSFACGGRIVRGIPADWQPTVEVVMPDANIVRRVFTGRSPEGLEIRAEIQEYRDYPVAELLVFLTNRGDSDTPVLSDLKSFDGALPCPGATLVHGNGDTQRADGYEWFRDGMDAPLSLFPSDGTSCNGAFPYMRLLADGWTVSLAVGWPAMWRADFAPVEDGLSLRVGQKRCATVLRPGETLRSPRTTLMAAEGGETRSVNLWRRWYIDHILPREHGRPLPPMYCLHVFNADGHPEFTGAGDANQLPGLDDYLRAELKPDLWWVDAGWYPCDYEWTRTGTWSPDPARFPEGLAPLGEKCAENGVRFLLWFEPERVRPGTQLDLEHPEWLLTLNKEDGSVAENRLLNLGDPACCDRLIEHVDALIKASGVNVYRQDFNFDPAPYWVQHEAPDRIGALENFHVQGYLRYWDALLLRNPGLWIDSCASGGRRNDLETMRRAVPLHYTDVGYGHHPIKQKQHFQMFAWIPYFRAHNMNWDDPVTGEYGTANRAPDRYSYYAAMAPAMTDMIEHDASPEAFALARQMQAIWRAAAERMLNADYYPLTGCRKSAEDFYAVQFHNPDEDAGFVEILRNNRCPDETFPMALQALDGSALYGLTDPETGETLRCSGAALIRGIEISLPQRSGRLYFYKRIGDDQ